MALGKTWFLYSSFFFEYDLFEDTTRSKLQKEVVDQLVLITKTLIHDNRVELVPPIMLDLLEDDTDEEKRIIGLEMLDALSPLILDFYSQLVKENLNSKWGLS